MKKDINQAVKELTPLYDETTTSDLQGLADVQAWNIFKKHNPNIKFADCFWQRSDIANTILELLYDSIVSELKKGGKNV